MMNIPKPTEYLAALYRPATHAPNHDYYIFADDLAKLGISFVTAKDNEGKAYVRLPKEVRVPFELNERLIQRGGFVFIADGLGYPTLALEQSWCADGVRSELVIAPEDDHASNRILWIEQNCGPETKLRKSGTYAYVKFSDEDYVLYRLRWENR
jgi:hypothetical protein